MKKNLAGPYVPPSVPKESSGQGSYYGTLGGSVKSFSAVTRARAKYKEPGRNLTTNPGKKGTGFG